MERVIGYTESFWVSAMQFIAECTAKRKEILDAAKDTADDTELPDIEALVDDALSFGYLTEQDEYVVMMRQDDGGYRRKSYPADGTVVYEDAEADDARVEVVDQYVVIRETHEFPIVGEWTRDRRKFLKCEIRIHVPAGSIAQGEYDIT